MPDAEGYYIRCSLAAIDIRSEDGLSSKYFAMLDLDFYMLGAINQGPALGITSLTFKSDADTIITLQEARNQPSHRIAIEAGLTTIDLSDFESLWWVSSPTRPDSIVTLVSMELTPQSVPVPSAIWLIGSGIAGMVVARKKIN